jgi:catechol 2,3-dioxygenase-like lactoylglutathione lyase family enzyme
VLNKAQLIAFVATQDSASSRKFYQQTLGLKLVSEDPFAIVFHANGIMLRVQKVQKVKAGAYTALGWQVTDIRTEVRQLTKRGVRFERFEGMPQDEFGIWKSPAGASVAWFKDPDGNILSLTQFGED